VHLHLLRHQRNTELLRQLGADKANIVQHYAKSSTVLQRIYGQLTNQDHVQAFHEAEGTLPSEHLVPEPIDEPAEHIICPMCQLENRTQFRFYGGCGQPLVEAAFGETVEAEHVVDQILVALLENPDVMQQLKEWTHCR
jgi:hypothetical protein